MAERLTAEQQQQARLEYEAQIAAIEGALGYSTDLRLRSVYGMRRWLRGGEESPWASLAREAELIRGPGWRPGTLWGREWWLTSRDTHADLVALTVTKSGRIVRGWVRHFTDGEHRAYDTPGKRNCPIEATWLPSAAAGRITFPACPFQRAANGDPEGIEITRRLETLRPPNHLTLC